MNDQLKHIGINESDFDRCLDGIYGSDAVGHQKDRCSSAIGAALAKFSEVLGTGVNELSVFRAPGRTEIGGNHTDHQHGQVLAAAIDRDILAIVAVPSDAGASCGGIRIYSEGFGWIDTDSPEKGTPGALVHGVVDGMNKCGYRTGGFCAYFTSDVPEGTGLSSSAAFEVLIAAILNELYNDGNAAADEIARIAQAAENDYYGKPCGLMDQTAIATGGLCHMDFSDPLSPAVRKLNVDFSSFGYRICITDTHGSHSDYTDDYVGVQTDLAAAAGVFGKQVLENISIDEVIAHSREIRQAGGDRAFLRAMHVTAENARVAGEIRALEQKNMPEFLDLVRQSGNSSYKLLQNVYTDRTPEKQELAVALAISEAVLEESGACRVHGGGFAGTIQAFVPEEMVDEYIRAMDGAFGEGSCFTIRVCPEGGVRII